MKPISQILELVVELIPGYPYRNNPNHFSELEVFYYNKFAGDLKKTAKKLGDIKRGFVQQLVFDELCTYAESKIKPRATIDKWFKPTTANTAISQNNATIDISMAVSKKAIESNNKNTLKKQKQGSLINWIKKN